MIATPVWYGSENHDVNLETLQELAVRISGERSVDAVLQSIVYGLAEQPSVALARVWVTGPGDVCGSCRMPTSSTATCSRSASKASCRRCKSGG